jgi:hypothetical protein
VCIILGLSVEEGAIADLTRTFLKLKNKRFPGLRVKDKHQLDGVLKEVKGADIRKAVRRDAGRKKTRHALGFLDKLLDLLEGHGAQLFGRVWIKRPAEPVEDKALYNFSVQSACETFNRLLADADDYGLIIADSRVPGLNVGVAHSVFTQKYKLAGDGYPRLLEMPTFGDSRNHVGIQLADLVASSLIFPMATYAFCSGQVESVHVDPGFGRFAEKFGTRLQRLQYRYCDETGRWRGGLTVSDQIGHLPGGRLFHPRLRRGTRC